MESSAEEFFYMIRPHCVKFLKKLEEYYEIVIYTAADPEYADWIIPGFDQSGLIKHRLYRPHCV